MKAYITGKHKVVEIISYVIMMISLILTIVYIVQHGSETVPVHYNWKGEVDGYGSAFSVVILPGTMLLVNLMISLIGHLCPPESFNIPVKLNPANAYAVYGDGLMLLFLLELELSVFCLHSAFSYLFDFAEYSGWFIFIFVAAVFLTIIVEMIRMFRHNNL